MRRGKEETKQGITINLTSELSPLHLPMRVTGMPLSRAEMAVHFPVPFCPAESRIFSTKGFPSVSCRTENSIGHSTSHTILDHPIQPLHCAGHIRWTIKYSSIPGSLSRFVCAYLAPSSCSLCIYSCTIGNFHGHKFSQNSPKSGFQKYTQF